MRRFGFAKPVVKGPRTVRASIEMLGRPGTAPSLALGGGETDMRRTSSAHALLRKKQDLFASAPASDNSMSQPNLMTRSKRASSVSGSDPDANHQVIGWKPASGFRIHTPPSHAVKRAPVVAGRIESEEYGRLRLLKDETCVPNDFGPGVRKRYIPHIKELSYPSEEELRVRPRPSSAIVAPKQTCIQEFVLSGMHRSSDLIGSHFVFRERPPAGVATSHASASRPPSAPTATAASSSKNEGDLGPEKVRYKAMYMAAQAANTTVHAGTSNDPAVLNYEAQFLYNDFKHPAEAGIKQKSTTASILRAVEWQKSFTEDATALSSWDAKLNLSGKQYKDAFVGDAYAAARIKQRQAMADMLTKKTKHSLTGVEMLSESFDNVYSEAHSNKDTISALGSGTSIGFLVPTVDQRKSILLRQPQHRTLDYGQEPHIRTAKGLHGHRRTRRRPRRPRPCDRLLRAFLLLSSQGG